jgi:hypothetical protein
MGILSQRKKISKRLVPPSSEGHISQVAAMQMVHPQSPEYSPTSYNYNVDDKDSDSDGGSKEECTDIKAL